jgi:hypothetical protein
VLPSIRRTGGYAAANGSVLAELAALTETVKKLAEIVSQSALNEAKPAIIAPDLSFYRKHVFQTKMESFPSEIVEQVDLMLEKMLIGQSLNFKKIERFCKASGYPISSVSVKRYFQTGFKSRFDG